MKATITTIDQNTHLFTSGLLAMLLGCICLYIFFVSSAVNEVVHRKAIVRDIGMVRSEIAALEASYMSAQHVVSERIAKASDFQTAEEKVFVSRTPASLVLSVDTVNN